MQSDEVAADQSSTQACPARMAFLSVKHRQKGVLPPVSTMQLLQEEDTLQGTSPYPTFGKGKSSSLPFDGLCHNVGWGKTILYPPEEYD